MLFPFVIGRLAAVVLLLLLAGTVLFVGRERLALTRRELRTRIAAVAPYAGLLAVVLVANKVARDVGPDVSLLIGVGITGQLERIDRQILWPLFREETPQFVVWLQSMATQELTAYFSFIYVYGYVFLLVFPLVAYFALPRPEPLRRTIVAYCANYVIGVVCYVLFIAYGPRNIIVEQADGLLYSQYAQYQFVTTAVNDETNVFPSLHTSMAVTAALLAWTTRDEYPLWVPVAALLAVSVAISTMYLGIHWATDVVFGIALAWVSVELGKRYEETPPTLGRLKAGAGRVWRAIPVSRR
ncbi:probable PAP2-type phosphatase [Natronomonas pharaonis DSM 2160]|uniref:Probable PAP2-type phosphatase n=1 Tax=Natronomonas pharaonis (strain ATCC 35678 / DSM 2160 / CIP 103997 / JCM 8858 / NBRC 14720 / NCIMB 2260 / Gabara) TaxID=348780 RepID=A0A1U7EWV2_NATPD|nr:phosphatase PAP2 family protein [Natronomonas pharaonis]CAI49583.1 probable PAP2-type phosphatase [Natronomonas pharaonis DSM 2160]